MGAGFRFIHAADLHVDSPFRGLSEVPPPLREALMASTFAAVQRLTETAIASNADFVVIAGDLYDAADRSLRAQLALQREWKKLHAAGVGLFVIHGNHDHLSGARANLEWPSSVKTFSSKEVECFPAYRKDGELAAYVYGMSYGTRAVTENIAARYKPRPDGPYHIAILHGNVDGDAAHDPYAPCSLSQLAGAGFHYWALGHVHGRRVLHTYPHIVYAGNTQGRHARECGAKGCYIVDVGAGNETALTFVALDTVRWLESEASIEGLTTEQSLIDSIENSILESVAESGGGRHVMIKLQLTGRGAMHKRITDADFLQQLREGLQERLDDSEALLEGLQERLGDSEALPDGLQERLNESEALPDGLQGRLGDSEARWVRMSEGGQERPICWIHAIEANTGAELDAAALANEDSFAGELLRLSMSLEHDAEERLSFEEEALGPLMSNPRLRKLIRENMKLETDRWLVQARELVAGLLIDDSNSPTSLAVEPLKKGET